MKNQGDQVAMVGSTQDNPLDDKLLIYPNQYPTDYIFLEKGRPTNPKYYESEAEVKESAYTPGYVKKLKNPWKDDKTKYPRFRGRMYFYDVWRIYNFEVGKSYLKKDHQNYLVYISREITEKYRLWKGYYNIELFGHTSPSGENTLNRKLARNRASEVQKFLELCGIAKLLFRIDLSEIWSIHHPRNKPKDGVKESGPDTPDKRNKCRSVTIRFNRIGAKSEPPSPLPPFSKILEGILDILRKQPSSPGRDRLLKILPMLNKSKTDDRFVDPYNYNKLVLEPREPFDEDDLPKFKQSIDLPFFWRHYRSNPNLLAKQLIRTEYGLLY
ncbi:MAG: hypothetical protein WBM44_22280, partial [Waterburya sp.]